MLAAAGAGAAAAAAAAALPGCVRLPLVQQPLALRALGTLVVAELSSQTGGLASTTLHTITAAQSLQQPVSVLVAGEHTKEAADRLAQTQGVSKVLLAQHASLKHHMPEPLSALLKALQDRLKFSYMLAPGSTFGKNLLPRAAALLGCQPLTDVTAIVDQDTFVRPIYAGNALVTLKFVGSPALRVMTVRSTSFPPAPPASGPPAPQEPAPQDSVDAAAAAAQCGASQWTSEVATKSDRPELGSAQVVVCGGRALKSAENFKMMESLADALGGAVGASRAAVDAGMVPNDLQVGQTGKVVAPKLYIGVGISGAIQHMAGIKDAKTIVAINNDPEAPIFQDADYGLCGDLFELVPELEKQIRQLKAAP